MEEVIFLGDVHGDMSHVRRVANQYPNKIIVQIGDFGVGTPQSNGGQFDESSRLGPGFIAPKYFLNLPSNVKFFCGNHDCRVEANKLPMCLGDFGEAYGFFFVSGADSFDKDMRINGISWWPDEELNHEQSNKCLDAWAKSSAEVLVCHDCPQRFAENYLLIYERSHTRMLIDEMMRIRRPKLVISGHHHRKMVVNHHGIQWRGLDIRELFSVDKKLKLS